MNTIIETYGKTIIVIMALCAMLFIVAGKMVAKQKSTYNEIVTNPYHIGEVYTEENRTDDLKSRRDEMKSAVGIK